MGLRRIIQYASQAKSNHKQGNSIVNVSKVHIGIPYTIYELVLNNILTSNVVVTYFSCCGR